MAKYKITADVQVKVWQKCEFEVEADSLDEAKQKIKEEPQSTCTGFEDITDTEEVIEVDFECENFRVEKTE